MSLEWAIKIERHRNHGHRDMDIEWERGQRDMSTFSFVFFLSHFTIYPFWSTIDTLGLIFPSPLHNLNKMMDNPDAVKKGGRNERENEITILMNRINDKKRNEAKSVEKNYFQKSFRQFSWCPNQEQDFQRKKIGHSFNISNHGSQSKCGRGQGVGVFQSSQFISIVSTDRVKIVTELKLNCFQS